jgi:hypothetical protein
MSAEDSTTMAAVAVVSHLMLNSVAVVDGVMSGLVDGFVSPGDELASIVARRHLERLTQFLSMLTRGQLDLAAAAAGLPAA